MDKDLRVWLFDILNAIDEIEGFVESGQMSFSEYRSDLRTKRAVERNLGIIGEAMNRILKHDRTVQISYSREIVDVRNRIVHGYDSVSDEIVWGIISKYLSVLNEEVWSLLYE